MKALSPNMTGNRRLAGSVPVRLHREFARPDPLPPEPMAASQRRHLRGQEAVVRFEAERAYLGRTMVPTKEQASMADLVVDTVEYVRHTHPGAHPLPYAVGGSGTGKTFAVRMGARRLYRSWCTPEELDAAQPPSIVTDRSEDAFLPVVWVTVSSTHGGPGAAIKSLAVSILKALGYDPRYRSSTDVVPQLVDRVARHGVRLLVLDDVGNFDLARKDARTLFNFVKHLNETLGGLEVTIACTENRPVDLPEVVSLTDNEQTAVRARTVEFEPFMIDPDGTSDTAVDRAWRTYLTGWEKVLAPVLLESVPGDLADHGRLLWGHASGRLVALQPHLVQLATHAIRTGSLRITPDLIRSIPPAGSSLEGLRRRGAHR